MFDMIFEMFSYNFIVRAFIVGTLVSLCAALLGVTLVLKRYSMIGDGLSHVGFGALAVAAALNLAPLEVAVPVIIIAAFLLLRLSENSKINGDAAIAIISSTALAIGVVFVSVSGVNTGHEKESHQCRSCRQYSCHYNSRRNYVRNPCTCRNRNIHLVLQQDFCRNL